MDGPDETLTALGEGWKTNGTRRRRATHTYKSDAHADLTASKRLGIEQIYQLLNLESETRPLVWLCPDVLHTPGYTLAQLEASSGPDGAEEFLAEDFLVLEVRQLQQAAAVGTGGQAIELCASGQGRFERGVT